MKSKLLIGTAGAGKTQWLAREAINIINSSPEILDKTYVAVVSYTKSAAKEIKDRIEKEANERAIEIPEDTFLFGTIHSILFNLLPPEERGILMPDDYLVSLGKELADRIGMKISGKKISLALKKGITEGGYDEVVALENIRKSLKSYNIMTYDEIINKAIDLFERDSISFPSLWIWDEIQDWGDIEEKIISALSRKYGRDFAIIGGGDLFQSIFLWRGDGQGVYNFISQKSPALIFQNRTYRLPRKIAQVASVFRLQANLFNTRKINVPTSIDTEKRENGGVYLYGEDQLTQAFLHAKQAGGKTAILCRTNKSVNRYREQLQLVSPDKIEVVTTPISIIKERKHVQRP
jgi:superfamily I DNA/RNA helicase